MSRELAQKVAERVRDEVPVTVERAGRLLYHSFPALAAFIEAAQVMRNISLGYTTPAKVYDAALAELAKAVGVEEA